MKNNPIVRIDKAETIQVIRIKVVVGAGVDNDPVRHMFEYWSLDGYLLAKYDDWEDNIKGVYLTE